MGGWLVLEPWITPSIFEAAGDSVVDEYTLCETLGSDAAASVLEAHWASWITQSDIQAVAAAGLNHVRIGVGYWAVNKNDGDPYVSGQLEYLDQAVSWAEDAGIKVLIDLHGGMYLSPLFVSLRSQLTRTITAQGSQNGFDNSGRRGSVEWGTGDTTSQSIETIRLLSERYLSSSAVTAIELLNEPLPPDVSLDTYKQFCYDGWGTVRDSNADTVVAIHDAFQSDISYWNGFMDTAAGVNNVMLDTHQYQVFTDAGVAMTPDEHVSAACAIATDDLIGSDKWIIVGEWTGALTDCAKYLNGRGYGARYDGSYSGSSYVGSCDGKSSGTVAALSSDDKTNIRRYNEAQLDAYEQGNGWIFWTWKTEGAPEWDLQAQLAGGLFPQPLTDREYAGQCSSYF